MNTATVPTSGDPDGYPELLRDLADLVGRQLCDVGIEHARAVAIGETVIETISDAHGGRQFYLPKANATKARRRWLRMWEEFNGHNHAELSVKYGMNIKQVYRVLAIVREEKRRQMQGDLFQAPPQGAKMTSDPTEVAA